MINTLQFSRAVFHGDDDLNDLRVGGVYEAVDPTNAPEDDESWIILVLPNSRNSTADLAIVQIACNQADGAIWRRAYNDTSWGSWALQGGDGVTPEAGDITVNPAVSTETNVQDALAALEARIVTLEEAP